MPVGQQRHLSSECQTLTSALAIWQIVSAHLEIRDTCMWQTSQHLNSEIYEEEIKLVKSKEWELVYLILIFWKGIWNRSSRNTMIIRTNGCNINQ